MKVCSFNVNSVKARKDLVLEWLDRRANDIDVLCLQEIKTEDDAFPAADFESRGFGAEVYGQKAYNGVAILSKIVPTATVRGFGQAAWDEQKRLIRAGIGGLEIINVYAPHGDVRGTDKFEFKRRWYENLLRYLESHFSPGEPLLLVGDLNVARGDIDVYSPEALEDTIGTMPEERRALEALLDWGLVDAFRALYPEKQQFTWWGYMAGHIWKDKGMRIDYALCTRPVLPKISAVEVDLWPRKRRQPTPSDHAPLVIDVETR